ncbi:FeoA family protein [Phaeovulum vinaykumarii]|uniref:Ferrous iron transport protein A n=1 Tax=Phaeovulum vinaykumarii TaxID=407234 RepID=A0A1N7M7R9_9RHOB|nr:FeoA family protein [Phaeovulum vinaykumarii]SIS82155.1 ferrous iron transport protein A [Phaeovulum vinaykumarii]SOC11169.1 ferrous iron transport protein A [Phaeovulum vinaykumarii]
MQAERFPLAMAPVGQLLTVITLAGGTGMRRRMSEMGIIPGCRVRVLRAERTGPVLVALGEGRLALGQDISRRIFVTTAQA